MKLSKRLLLCLFCLIALNYYKVVNGVLIDSVLDDKEYSNEGDNVETNGRYSYIVDSNKVYLVGIEPQYNSAGNIVIEDVINIPSQIDGKMVVGIYTETFATSHVKKVVLPATIEVVYENAFVNCTELENIEVDGGNITYASYNGLLYSKDYQFLVKCPEGKTGEVRVKEGTGFICDYSFYNCTKITKIYIPSSVVDISDTVDGEGVGIGVFYDTKSLQQIEVSNSNKSYAVSDGVLYRLSRTTGKPKALVKCPDTRTASITIPSTVEKIDDFALMDCYTLSGNINLPTNLKSIGERAFWNCEKISGTVTIPDSTTSIGIVAFSGCKNISRLVIGSGLKQISDDCFSYDTSLKEIVIPGTVDTIGERAFLYCINAQKIELNEGVRIIGNWAFDYNYAVKGNLIIPDSVEKIGVAAFYNCKELDGYIVIGEKVYQIGESAFYYCSKSKGMMFKGMLPSINDYTFVEPNITYYHLNGMTGFENALKGKNVKTFSLNPVVKFMVNGALYDSVTLNSYGMCVPNVTTPNINGYNFLGWYYDSDYTRQYNPNDEIMDDTTIYANMVLANSINFDSKELVIHKGDTQKISFTYKFEDGSDASVISWKSLDDKVATVDEFGNVTGIEKGETTITASYKNVTASITVKVWKEENKLNFLEDSIDVQVDDVLDLEYEYSFLNNATKDDISWDSSRPDIVRVENGKIYALDVGRATITASYEDVSDTIEINVLRRNVITINNSEIVMEMNSEKDIDYTYYFNDNATSDSIVWKSSNTNVAKVENGKIKSNLDGTATITASYKDASASVKVVVKGKDTIRFNRTTYVLYYEDGPYRLAYSWNAYGITGDDIIWDSSDKSVATVEGGVVTPLASGQTTITAICGSATATTTVRVIRSNELNFANSQNVFTLDKNATLDIQLNYYFNDGATLDDIEFTSDNLAVVKIVGNKFVQVGIGKANITASYSGYKATTSVEIVPDNHIRFEKIGYILKPGEEFNLPFDVYTSGAQDDIIFESSDDDIVEIDNTGKITTKEQGDVTITARCGNLEATVYIVVDERDDYVKGDVNLDGRVNSIDSSMISDFYIYENATILQKILSDMDNNMKINSIDSALVIDEYLAI